MTAGPAVAAYLQPYPTRYLGPAASRVASGVVPEGIEPSHPTVSEWCLNRLATRPYLVTRTSGEFRNPDPPSKSRLLYPLSYGGIFIYSVLLATPLPILDLALPTHNGPAIPRAAPGVASIANTSAAGAGSLAVPKRVLGLERFVQKHTCHDTAPSCARGMRGSNSRPPPWQGGALIN